MEYMLTNEDDEYHFSTCVVLTYCKGLNLLSFERRLYPNHAASKSGDTAGIALIFKYMLHGYKGVQIRSQLHFFLYFFFLLCR